ncbi:MAG: hypothetical protein JW937_07750, partial [Candidatus Omnitrophica bacterium]|nr:hypothetical protein [Candidatus Omnitrophota bacterium]
MDRTTETEAARLFGPLRDRFRYRFAFLRAKLRPSYFFRHFTLKRALNFLLVKAEKALHRQTMKGRPYHIFVDPGNICNFKCPLCITGRDGNRRPKALMSFERFEEMMEPLADTALV